MSVASMERDGGHDLGAEIGVLVDELVSTALSLSSEQRRVETLLILAALIASLRGSTRLPLRGGVQGPLGRALAELLDPADKALTVPTALREIHKLIDG